jgi:hypothetical protein
VVGGANASRYVGALTSCRRGATATRRDEELACVQTHQHPSQIGATRRQGSGDIRNLQSKAVMSAAKWAVSADPPSVRVSGVPVSRPVVNVVTLYHVASSRHPDILGESAPRSQITEYKFLPVCVRPFFTLHSILSTFYSRPQLFQPSDSSKYSLDNPTRAKLPRPIQPTITQHVCRAPNPFQGCCLGPLFHLPQRV